MKKLDIRRTFSFTLLLLFLICGSTWAANFSFTDPVGQWWTGSDFSITIDWSNGWAITEVEGDAFSQGTGDVVVSLNTDKPIVKSYFLDARAISNTISANGPVVGVLDIIFFPWTNISANSSDNFFVAWDLSTMTLMFYDGDPLGNCYTYLGLDFSPDLLYSLASDTSITFTSKGVEAIVGQQLCNNVPIPGAIWLFCSGLFGLVCIRRRSKI